MSSDAVTTGEPAGTRAALRPERERISPLRRVWLTLEMLVFFVATPIGVYSLLYDFRIPLFTLLLPVFVFFIFFLTFDRSFSWREHLRVGISLPVLASILAVFAVAGPAIALFAYHDVGDRFLRFPRFAYDTWIMVMILYPVISVTTQEIMYRVFFFHRYGALFAGDPQAGIMLNAVLFSFSHIVFQNLTTLVISFLGGLLFAWRYQSSRSYWALVLEHALYGNLIFTVGLGRYFYTGVSNF
ncbi:MULTISPECIES: CPBP family intramembrane glutamic endopeptidase [Rhodomicrobium]|uniref:CPBP family intramembrane glutamic endopeptidase n=1 Tax=Rhodomicrobium TaxID=1068 RepID=UPI000B4A9A8D|nr:MULTISPECIES: CPBP family intramembrane glutamic endopeptidase [Rhodomicrobium]